MDTERESDTFGENEGCILPHRKRPCDEQRLKRNALVLTCTRVHSGCAFLIDPRLQLARRIVAGLGVWSGCNKTGAERTIVVAAVLRCT